MKRVLFAIILIVLCLGLAFAGFLGWRYFRAGEKLTATIISPKNSLILESGQGIAVSVLAEAEAGVSRVVLVVNGELYAEENASGENTLTVAFPWYATAVGSQTVEALIYDRANQVSEPVSVLLGVRAHAERNLMDFLYIPPAEESGGETGNADTEAGAAAGQIVPVGENGEILGEPLSPDEVGGQEDLPVPDENDLAGNPLTEDDLNALEEAGDGIPVIAAFEANPRRAGQSVQIAYHVEARDDLGVNRLEFYVENTLTGDSSTRTMLCFDEISCTVDDVYPFAGEGRWTLSVFAVDTSGQASEPQVVPVEIIGHPQFDPALAIGNAFADRPLVADHLIRDEAFGIPIDFNEVDPNIQIETAVITEQRCAQALVEPRENGNFVSLVVLCEEEAPQDTILEWKVDVWPTPLGNSETVFYRLDREGDFSVLSYGQNFAFLHETPFCGTSSNYRIFVRWVRKNNNRETVRGGNIVDVWDVPGRDCNTDAIIQDFQAEPLVGVVQLSWRIAQRTEQALPLPYTLRRYDPATREKIVLQEGVIAPEQLAQGDIPFAFSDENVSCGFNPYFYSVELPTYENRAESTVTVEVERVPCPEGSIGNISMELSAGYSQIEWGNFPSQPLPGYYSVINAHSAIPANFPWPQADNLVLRLNTESLLGSVLQNPGEFEVLPGSPTEIQITDSVRANGFVFDSLAYAECSGLHHQWGYGWELLSNGVPIETGHVFEVESAPCLPKPSQSPVFTEVRGIGDWGFCGGEPPCVSLSWDALPPFPENIHDPRVLLPVDALGVYRRTVTRNNGNVEAPDEFWLISAENDWFPDIYVPCTENAGDLVYAYSLIPMAQGVHSGSNSGSVAFIDSPACVGDYTAFGEIIR